MEEENKDLEDKISQGEKGLKRIEKRILSLENILEFKDYHELNWKKIAIEIKALKEKLLEFTNSSDKLKTVIIALKPGVVLTSFSPISNSP